MNRYKAAPLLLVLFSCTVLGQVEVGLVGGVTRNAANGAALADAHVIAHNLKLGTDHATTSDDHGIFTFTNLEPGLYEITATKNGFQESSAHVGIVARQTARVDLPLRIADNSQVSDNQPLTARERQLLERIDRLEARLAAVEAKNGEPMHASPDPTPGFWGATGLNETDGAQSSGPASTVPFLGAVATFSPGGGGGCGPSSGRADDSGSPSGARSYYWRRQCYAIRVRRLYLAQRHAAQQRHRAGYEILHAGNSLRHSLHGRISTSRSITPSLGRPSHSAPAKFRSSRPASAAISTGRTFAAESCS